MIRTILIDIDNTLLDFHKCADACIRRGFRELGLPYTDRTFPTFITINDDLWRDIEQGRLTREGLRQVRWDRIFRELDLRADGVAFEDRFGELLFESHEPVEGALEALRYLSGKYAVYAASNASYAQQRHRLELAGMLPYIRDIFASREIGAAKPTPAFFAACLERIGNPPKDEVLLLGDSLTADVEGGIAFGLHTGWYNHAGAPHDIALPVDFIVDHLSQIPQYL